MNHADVLRDLLNQAIAETVRNRASYADDFRHFTRDRKLPLEQLIKLLLTMTGGTIARELYDAEIEMAVSSFVESRKRLGYLSIYHVKEMFDSLCADPATLKSYKIWSIDGSTLPCPRNQDSKNHYTSEANPRGYNNIHANICFDILNQVVIDVAVGEGDSRRSHDEQGALYTLLYKRRFQDKTIILLDRGYESFSSIYHLSNISNLFFVLRVKNNGLRPIRALPMEELDRDLEWTVTSRQTNEAKENGWIFIQTGSKKGKANSPNTRITRFDFPPNQDTVPLKCRAARFKLDTDFETLLTNLPREEFSVADLKELYSKRWRIEVNIRFWKYAVGALSLHSRTDELILQELYAHFIMFNFANRILREIEIPQKPGNKYRYEVDRTMGIYLCKKFFREPGFTGEKQMQDIRRFTQPIRPNRADIRDLKVRPATSFPYRIPS